MHQWHEKYCTVVVVVLFQTFTLIWVNLCLHHRRKFDFLFALFLIRSFDIIFFHSFFKTSKDFSHLLAWFKLEDRILLSVLFMVLRAGLHFYSCVFCKCSNTYMVEMDNKPVQFRECMWQRAFSIYYNLNVYHWFWTYCVFNLTNNIQSSVICKSSINFLSQNSRSDIFFVLPVSSNVVLHWTETI